MAISTAAALLGSAVIGAGASYAANKSATKTAANAANQAADANAAVNQRIYDQTRADLAPYNQAGTSALAALQARLGLSPGGAQATPVATAASNSAAGSRPSVISAQGFGGYTPIGAAPGPGGGNVNSLPQTPQGPTADLQGYLTANPDVAQFYDTFRQTPEGAAQLASLGVSSPEQFAQYHYDTFGQQEGRALPMTEAAAPAVDPNAPPDLMNQARPDALEVPTFERPTDMTAPDLASYFTNFEADPGYQFRLTEGLNAVNSASAAAGKLRSGDAAKALQARGEGLAAQGYQDWWNRQAGLYDRANQQYQYGQNRSDQNFLDDRSYGTNLWNTQQNRRDNIFSEDRGYQTGRYDTLTGNLFSLTGIGQNAAAGAANAGNVFATNSAANNNSRANTTANAAIAGANNVTNLFGSAANAAGTFYGLRGAGSSTPRQYVI